MRNTKLILGATLTFTALLLLLNGLGKYHLFYVEQFQLFQDTLPYFLERMAYAGGFARWLGEWLTQFFIVPYGGPAVVAAFLTLILLMGRHVIQALAPSREWPLLYALPLFPLFFIQMGFNYAFGGTVAYALASAAFCPYVGLRGERARWAYAVGAVAVVFWLGGAVACWLAGVMALWEMLTNAREGWKRAVVVIGEFTLLAVMGVSLTWVDGPRFIFTPEMYYHPMVAGPPALYLVFLLLPAAMLIARFCPRGGELTMRRKALELGAQLITLGLIFWGSYQTFGQHESAFLKELDYYARTRQWDRVLERCRRPLDNYLYINYLNLALAEKGLLAEHLFDYDQHGLNGLLLAWDKTYATTTLLSEFYYMAGQVAVSQQCAFEANIIASGKGSARHTMRLAETNLINGEYKVAEKYLDVLSRTWHYADWAERRRALLYDDDAVAHDPILGPKRAMWQAEEGLANLAGLDADLKARLSRKPDDTLAAHYIGVYYLLAKDLPAFREFIETYYGTPALPSLPRSFQEAVILLEEQDVSYWRRFNLSAQVIQNFASYRQAVLSNRTNPRLPALLNQSFGNTYWFYYIYKQ